MLPTLPLGRETLPLGRETLPLGRETLPLTELTLPAVPVTVPVPWAAEFEKDDTLLEDKPKEPESDGPPTPFELD